MRKSFNAVSEMPSPEWQATRYDKLYIVYHLKKNLRADLYDILHHTNKSAYETIYWVSLKHETKSMSVPGGRRSKRSLRMLLLRKIQLYVDL